MIKCPHDDWECRGGGRECTGCLRDRLDREEQEAQLDQGEPWGLLFMIAVYMMIMLSALYWIINGKGQ